MLFAESTGSMFPSQISHKEGAGGSRRERCDIQISAHDTIPHSPPATRTASGFECVPAPPNVVRSCLLLSYVIKYVAVPRVSLTVWVEKAVSSLAPFYLVYFALNRRD